MAMWINGCLHLSAGGLKLPDSSATYCVTLGESLNFSVPQPSLI